MKLQREALDRPTSAQENRQATEEYNAMMSQPFNTDRIF